MALSSFHRLIMGKLKMALTAKLLQIFAQKFYRNVPSFLPAIYFYLFLFLLVMKTKMLKNVKKILK